jgi:hypothetical protein
MHNNSTPAPNGPNTKVVSCMTSLASYPANIKIYGLNNDERILLFVREHRVILFFNLILYSVVLLLPLFIRVSAQLINSRLLNSTYTADLDNIFNSRFWTAGLVLWLGYILKGFYNIFVRWYYNVNILTSNRFIDLDLIGIFNNRLEETSVKDITDAKDVQPGLLQSLFSMGSLEIFTASGKTTFSLDNVPESQKIRDFIMDVVIMEKKKEDNI